MRLEYIKQKMEALLILFLPVILTWLWMFYGLSEVNSTEVYIQSII